MPEIISYEPKDEKNVVWYSFLYLGLCSLTGWSALLNSFDFLVWRVSFSFLKSLILQMPGYAPESSYPFANSVLVVLAQIWLTTTGDRFTYPLRVTIACSMTAIILAFIPFLAYLKDPINYWVIFVVLIPFGGFCGVLQGTVFTMAANLPFEYMGAVTFGNGLAAIGANLIRGITIWAFPVDPNDSSTDINYFYGAVTFLSIGAFMMILCVLLMNCVLVKNEFYIYYLDWKRAEKEKLNSYADYDEKIQVFSEDGEFVKTKVARAPPKEDLRQIFKVAQRNFGITDGLLWALLFSFINCFILFPGVTFDSELGFLANVNNEEAWYVLIMNTVFSVGDTIGRKMGGYKVFDMSIPSIKLMVALRYLFIITFYCVAFNVGPSWLFLSSWFKLVNMLFFAILNGYTVTLICIKAPSIVKDEEKSQVGAFLGTTIGLGILFGSLLAFA